MFDTFVGDTVATTVAVAVASTATTTSSAAAPAARRAVITVAISTFAEGGRICGLPVVRFDLQQ